MPRIVFGLCCATVLLLGSLSPLGAQISQVHGTWTGKTQGRVEGVAVCTFIQKCSQLEAECLHISAAGEWRRLLRGQWDAPSRSFRLQDVRFLTEKPAPGYRFCPIEQYELALSEDLKTLAGFYQSEGCEERATIVLHRAVE